MRDRAKDGTFFWTDSTIVPFLGTDGRPYQFMCIRKDITERKQAEFALEDERAKRIAMERLTAVGEMAAGIAHEIRNPLSAILLQAQWLSNRCIGLGPEGYGQLLELGLRAKESLIGLLERQAEDILVIRPADLNILNFSVARQGDSLSSINARTLASFERFRESPNFAVSRTELPVKTYGKLLTRLLRERGSAVDAPSLVCLRLVLMNPFLTTQETTTSYLHAFVAELGGYISQGSRS